MVAVHDSLGPAGGARAVRQAGGQLVIRVGHGAERAGQQLTQRLRADHVPDRRLVEHAGQAVRQDPGADQGGGARVGQHVPHLVRGEHAVDRVGDHPGPHHAEVAGDVGGGVRQVQADPVPRPQAEASQGGGEPAGGVAQLRVAEAVVTDHAGQVIGLTPGVLVEEGDQADHEAPPCPVNIMETH